MDMKEGRGGLIRLPNRYFDLLVGNVKVVEVVSNECRFNLGWFVVMEPCQ